jgi:peroxiredoxin
MRETAIQPGYARRLHELEQSFAALEPQIPESPEKQAFSVLHGMVQELWRSLRMNRAPDLGSGLTINDIANMYKQAPKMDGVAQNAPLPLGTPAPDFALPDPNGQLVRLSDYRGRPVVLIFYPLDWSPTCSDQLSLYQSELGEFERYGAKLLGISVDSIYSHGAWAAVRGITYPLLADFEPKGEVARMYHVWRPGDGFSERALYVVDGEGIIRYAHVSPRLGHIPDIYELYRALSEITGVPAPTSSAEAPVGVNGHAGH